MSVSAIWRLISREVPRRAIWKRLGSIRRILPRVRSNRRAAHVVTPRNRRTGPEAQSAAPGQPADIVLNRVKLSTPTGEPDADARRPNRLMEKASLMANGKADG